jgi:hypothetical protein
VSENPSLEGALDDLERLCRLARASIADDEPIDMGRSIFTMIDVIVYMRNLWVELHPDAFLQITHVVEDDDDEDDEL